MVRNLALVFVGGGLGAAMREVCVVLGSGLVPPSLPAGILAANLAAAFAIGLIVPLSTQGGPVGPAARLFLVTGVLGGLSTFSTLIEGTIGLESRAGTRGLGLAYLATSLAAGLVLVRLGEAAGRRLRGIGPVGPAADSQPGRGR